MKLSTYQHLAQKTDQTPSSEENHSNADIIIPLLGLAGEAGELLSEYKKHLRDGDSYKIFKRMMPGAGLEPAQRYRREILSFDQPKLIT